MRILIDGDSCPYKEQTYRVARRYNIDVVLVCNHQIRVPKASWLEPVVVGTEFDAVDNWIEANIAPYEIVITNDILLAERCIKKGAVALNTRGKVLDEDSIGEAVATRLLMQHLRHAGQYHSKQHGEGHRYRSRYLAALDLLITKQIKLSHP